MPPVALITGAAGGLGSAIAGELASRGWSLVLTDRPGVDLNGLVAELSRDHHPGVFSAISADLADPEQLTELVHAAGHLDCLVNNAALPSSARLVDVTVLEWDQVLAINLRAPMLLIQAVARVFAAQGTGGSIVNVASRVWATGGPAAYVAAKAGLVGLTHAAAFEFGPLGVRVNAVAPSAVETAFTTGSRSAAALADFQGRQAALSALGRAPDVREIATSVAFLAGSDSSFITGEVLHVCGGLQLPPMP
ncbi:SDR family oxidoreductase [Cryobacterium sp. PH29-G1]|uniref:SDR family NAD(P)-dependent oxidoreductase n=1 Tax=Cryobacterium sp. PH29-G1 TaxID=3046211 RepID=UPI0024B9F24D|nr:SDR family oxidoreductase [Cryobacterium sp. PH29-G1]MDJ0351063.1 SDR family oxidoreductase [Cryobacterium sp. PH29-G1]